MSVLVCMLSSASALKERAVMNSRRVKSPRVQSTDLGCAYKQNENSWCFTMTPPLLRAGWEYDQVFSTSSGIEYWQLKLKPYLLT
jgi:hypothetical protein